MYYNPIHNVIFRLNTKLYLAAH